MNQDLAEITICFPNGDFNDKSELVNSIVSLISGKEMMECCGYPDAELLKKGLTDYMGEGDIRQYREISDEEGLLIKKIIYETVEKSNEKLKVPTKNFIFVHPYLPTKEDDLFEGVMGVATYSCVFHIFISPDEYRKESLESVVVHELNHTIFYYRHYDDFYNFTLLDEMVLEGLAENFREKYFDLNTKPWANALSKDEAFEILNNSLEIINSRDQVLIKNFLNGKGEYKKWTGYSIGYWLVKDFIENNPDLSWEELMRTNSVDFLN